MATEAGCLANTETPSSPLTDFHNMSQPLVIDCPDPGDTVMDALFDNGNEPSKGSQNEVVAESCEPMLSAGEVQQEMTTGSTIAQTLQDLVSPGPGMYGSLSQTGTVVQQHVAIDGSMTIIGEGSNQQHVQYLTPQLQSPMSMLSTIDARQIQQQVFQQQQQQRPGSTLTVVSVSNPASRTSQSQPAMCHLAPQPQGLVAGHQTMTGFQGLVGGQGAAMFGAGTQMMCANQDSANQSQMDIAMACQQQYTMQAGATQGYQSPMMTAVPQTLQVIQTGNGQHQVVQQQCLQQQYMFQTNQVQTLQSVSSSRPSMKSPTLLSIAPQSSTNVGTRPLVAVTNGKGMVATTTQSVNYNNLKPMQQSQQQQNAPVVIGQLGMMQNGQLMQQNILSQQPRAYSLCPINQTMNLGQVNQQLNLGQSFNLGQVGQQLQFGQPLNFGTINQPINFGTVNQALNLGQVNQALNLGQVNQMIGGQTQIRLAAMPNFNFNTGQLVGNGPTVLNFQNVPMVQQQMLATQPTTILGSQPLYIRAAEPYVQQQVSTIAVANVQAATPVRNIVMGQPVQAATSTPSQQQPLRRLQQVQPNSSIAPATTSGKQSSVTSQHGVSVAPRPGTKTSKQPTTTSAMTTKSIAPATAGNSHRPVKLTVAVPVAAKSQPVSVLMPAVAGTPVVAVTSAVVVQTTSSTPSVTTTTSVVTTASPTSVASSIVSSPSAAVQKSLSQLEIVTSSPEKKTDPVIVEESKVRIKVEYEKKAVTQVYNSNKMSSKPKKPKILTHVIEGFIIQEASEPFPVHGSSLISQLWSPKIPVSADDGYSSPKSEKDTECGENDDDDDDDTDQEQIDEAVDAKKQKLDDGMQTDEPTVEAVPIVIAPIPAVPEVVESPASQSEPARLTCEFCNKRDLVQNFARSRRFCSVTCSKRFSAYSMRKAPDGSVTGRPTCLPNKSAVRRVSVPGSVHQRQPPVTNVPAVGPPVTVLPRAADPRISIVKASSVSASESSDTEMSSGTGTASQQSIGDSNSSSQLSPPALERVERIGFPENASNGDDGVLIPSKPLPQWTVQDVYDFIRTLPGCGMYADDFLQQEIDGSALMLLKEDHLMTTLNVKLGPALKICSKISSLRD